MARASLRLLARREVEAIHNATMELLERTGLLVQSESVRGLLLENGARVNPETNRLLLSEDLVKDSIKKAPKRFKLCAKNRKQDLQLPSKRGTYFSTDGFPSEVLDLETQEKRDAQIEDVKEFVTLADALDAIDFVWPSVTTSDVPTNVQFAWTFVEALRHTEKHVQYEALGREQARFEIEVAARIVGGEEELRKRPIFSAVQCPIGTLRYEKESLEAVVEFAKARIPVVAYSMPIPGATSPVTLASALVVGNAETLGSLVISQLVGVGAPVIYCQDSSPMDMRFGTWASGAPEGALVNSASVQLAKHYGLPCLTGIFGSSSKVPDAQVSYEKFCTAMLPVMAGADLGCGIGGLDNASYMSLQQMMIDSEIGAAVRRTCRGIEVTDESIALEIAERVGFGEQLLGHRHTLTHFKQELWMPQLSIRGSYEDWVQKGRKKMDDLAKESVKRILSSHQAAPLDPEINREILARLKEFEKSAQR